MDYKKLGQRIREYRTNLNITQEALAESVELSSVYISQIETGARKPSLETVFKIAVRFNIPMDYLVKDSFICSDNASMDEIIALLKDRSEIEIAYATNMVRELLKHLKKGKLIILNKTFHK